MSVSETRPSGFLTFTLHAHLPYVVNHGTWPHGMEWLHEAAAETYLPLLRVLGNLERDGIALNCNLNLSPILLEQLAHPVFKAEFPKYVERKIIAAREDEAFFTTSGEHHYAETARFWHKFFTDALDDFNALDGDIIKGFRYFNDKGLIEIITCGATHGYMPLLGTDESVRAQIRTAVNAHIRHIGKHPKGIWAPECGYRPAGFWNYPVGNADGSPTQPGFDRIGVEQALSESDIEFFFVDTHLVEESARIPSPYELLRGTVATRAEEPMTFNDNRRLYQPYFVDGPYDKRYATTIFPRDPRTGVQVWSGDSGYPGDGNYLDFHKKRWPGGHRYWRVTGPRVDMGDKEPYYPQRAAEQVKGHASHFVHLVWQALQGGFNDSIPPVLCSPFDAELFGHWWFEGPLWLEAVARVLHEHEMGLALASCTQYLEQYPRAGFIAMHEGSWGAEGTNHVWMNPDTSWTYTHIYPAEIYTRDVCTSGKWKDGGLGERIVKQLCRELLLLESSDWQFLITTGAARDYAELRFETHNNQFNEVKAIWQHFESNGSITPEQEERLAAIELRDSIFVDIDPSFWIAGARQVREGGRNPEDDVPQIVAASGETNGVVKSDLGKHPPVHDVSATKTLKFRANA
ncbi:1,4-alpha-glucan branching protein domain-containing protein [Granulicella sp. S156]|uniref:1,4-alpha-glucan branching protein domain-containing protein n=1 Tax=Granulicella sp. S156 TaxID=1747224 RepID=UPI00131D5EC5|nr:1,4-alpha-glucan branching protein domain-containing protein [Granulicella sp. S156]